MSPRTFQTADGSITCFDEITKEFFHNKAGAYLEAQINYVAPSNLLTLFTDSANISMLDTPFGLGYNSFVLLQEILELNRDPALHGTINIVGIESEASFVQVIDQVLSDKRFRLLKEQFELSSQNVVEALKLFQPVSFKLKNVDVRIDLRHGDMRKIVPQLVAEGCRFDAVLHDPFSPNKMPELWTTDLFKQYQAMMTEKGRICTYSVSVIVRGGFLEAGFQVYKTAPLGVKSGGTVATASRLTTLPDELRCLEPEEESRLMTKSGIPLRDFELKSTREEIRNQRITEQQNFDKKRL